MAQIEQWEALAGGSSGDLELEKKWLRCAKETFDIFCVKQRSYGPQNIAKFGVMGVIIRLNDKLERLITLNFRNVENPLADETQVDTWVDTADYGIIGLLCHRGWWPK